MPQIRSYALITGTQVPSAFPRATSPAYVHTDFPWESSPVNWGANAGVISLPVSQLIMPAQLRVPHNQRDERLNVDPTVKAYPYVEWQALEPNSATARYAYNYPYLNSEIGHENWDEDENQIVEFGTNINAQGFTYLYRRAERADVVLVGGEEGSVDELESAESDRSHELRWEIGTGDDARGYSITFSGNGQALLQYWDRDTGEYDPVKTGNAGDDVSAMVWGAYSTDNEYTAIEVLLAGGKMYVYLGSQDNPVVFDEGRVGEDGKTIQRVRRVEVRSVDHKTFYWSVFPTKFYASTGYDSVQFQIGFKSINNPNYKIIPAGGWEDLGDVSATLEETETDSMKGPNVTYRLVFKLPITGRYKGVPYGDFAPGVHAVAFHWPRGPVYSLYSPQTPLGPESIVVSQEFDPETLQIRSGASLNFSNTRGQWGEWQQESGHVAVTVDITRTAISGASTMGVPPWVKVFTGIGHTSSSIDMSDGGGTFTMHCSDRVVQLEPPRWALPWMDGWNSIYAIAYLAQLGGITLEHMAFARYVPDDPYDDWGDPSVIGGFARGAYFLPVGYMSTNLTRFSGAGLWEIMSKIAYSIGYQLYFDAYGYLHFHKFQLPYFDNNAAFPIKRTFFESDVESSTYGGGAEGCWSITSSKNMATVRNKSIVVGVNSFSPIWEPIVMVSNDDRSVLDPSSSNFVGWVQPVVMADNQFADPYFAWQAAKGLLRFLRMPERKVMFETWFQPDIYPLDCIYLRSQRIGTIGIKYMVTSVTHHIDQISQVGKTRISGTAMSILDPLIDLFGFEVN